jgi:hypothetical protein
MATGWAGVVIRCEQIEGSAPVSAPEDEGPVLLIRVQVSIGDGDPEILGPLVARRQDAGQLVATVLDRIFATLADRPPGEVDRSGPAPTSSDS